MAIHQPGVKFRRSRLLSRRKGKRDVVASLSLTAMVDMFTVLVIFLLQNYSATGEVLYIPKEVTLPQAEQIKELAPAIVVTLSDVEVLVESDVIARTVDVRASTDWNIPSLAERVRRDLAVAKARFEANLPVRLQVVADQSAKPTEALWNKVTIQADKGIDFATLKKVMFTVTEAGAGEINFAVIQRR